jgi:hypothetical protein
MCEISQLRPATVEDHKQLSGIALMTSDRQHGRCTEEHGKMNMCFENGMEHTVNF